MASLVQQGSWSSPSILAGYGLSAKIGPNETTPIDKQRLNSRSGGKFSGVGNWMQDYRPKPIMGSGRPKKMYDYESGDGVIVQKRPEGLVSRKIGKFVKRKFGKEKIIIKKDIMGPSRDADGAMAPINGGSVNGPENQDVIPGWLDKIENYGPGTNVTRSDSAGNTPRESVQRPDTEMQGSSRDRSSVSYEGSSERYVAPTSYGLNVTRVPPPPINTMELDAMATYTRGMMF